MVQSAMQDLFGVCISLGTVNRLRQGASAAVASPVAKTQEYVQQQPAVGADETSFARRNADRGWLRMIVCPQLVFATQPS